MKSYATSADQLPRKFPWDEFREFIVHLIIAILITLWSQYACP